jgi:CBASS immunity sensor of nucleotide second messenger signals
MVSPTSASGARIQGDDFQHLYAWYQAVGLLIPRENIVSVRIEAKGSGNVDDVVIVRSRPPTTYCQLKYAVDASTPLDSVLWTESGSENSRSLLKKFWDSWKSLSAAGPPDMRLVTNRAIDPGCPVMTLRDGRMGRLVPRLALASAGSAAGKRRREWAEHLGVTEQDLLSMLEHLALLTDQGPWAFLGEAAAARMGEASLRTDFTAVEIGIGAARKWVATGVREISAPEMERLVADSGLRGERRKATLLVEAIERDAWADSATVHLDWVDAYLGENARSRRALRDPAGWNKRFLPDLHNAAKQLRGQGFTDVLVRGHMRLPAWFAVGSEFSDTTQWRVSALQRGEEWAGGSKTHPREVRARSEDIGQGNELAVGVSITNDVSAQVLPYLRGAKIPVARYCDLSPKDGPARDSVVGASDAMSFAMSIRSEIWKAVAATQAGRVHLFLSTPAALALFLGHVWNRIPETQTYEDLGPATGYASAFTIPGTA